MAAAAMMVIVMVIHIHRPWNPHRGLVMMRMKHMKNPIKSICHYGDCSPFMLLGKVILTRSANMLRVVCQLVESGLPWTPLHALASAGSQPSSWQMSAKVSGTCERRFRMLCYGVCRWNLEGDQNEDGPLEAVYCTKWRLFHDHLLPSLYHHCLCSKKLCLDVQSIHPSIIHMFVFVAITSPCPWEATKFAGRLGFNSWA